MRNSVRPAAGVARMRHAAALGLPLLLYTLIALTFFGQAGSWTRQYFGRGPDPILFTWFIHWWPFAIAHGLNPFLSDYVWFPHGLNLTWSTSVPSAALLALPITLLGGPVLSFNVLSELAPAMSGWTAFLLARFLTDDWFAALVGGYLFGFSSYEIGQMLGHLNLDLTFLVPIAVLLCLARASGRLGRRRFVFGMTLVLIFELGLSSEILATSGVVGAIAWVIFFVFAPRSDRGNVFVLMKDIILAVFATILLSSPFLFYLVKGLPDVAPQAGLATMYSADPLNYIIPTIVTRIGRVIFFSLATKFTGNLSEQGAYLGLPLLLLMGLYFRDTMNSSYAKALLLTAAVVIVLSFGPSLQIWNIRTNVSLPWVALLQLPLIRSALPVRLTLYVSLCSAIVTSLYLAAPGIGSSRCWRFALAGLACVFLVPNTRFYAWTRWPTQEFFTPKNVARLLGSTPNVIILPFGFSAPNLAWQLDAGMRFRQSGGYVGLPPYTEWRWPVQTELATGTVWQSFGNDLQGFCAVHNIRYLLVGPGTPLPVAAAVAEQGWPYAMDHGVRVVRVPPSDRLRYSLILGDYWPTTGTGNWMGHQVAVVTHGSPALLRLTAAGEPIDVVNDLTLTGEIGRSIVHINQSETSTISIPDNKTVILTAGRTFIPDRIIHNGDYRSLSVMILLIPLPQKPPRRSGL